MHHHHHHHHQSQLIQLKMQWLLLRRRRHAKVMEKRFVTLLMVFLLCGNMSIDHRLIIKLLRELLGWLIEFKFVCFVGGWMGGAVSATNCVVRLEGQQQQKQQKSGENVSFPPFVDSLLVRPS